MAQEQNQNQEDEKSNAIDRINDLYNRAQNLRSATRLLNSFGGGGVGNMGAGQAGAGRVASGATRAGALFMNPVGAGILVFVLIVVILVFVLGNQAGGNSTNPAKTQLVTCTGLNSDPTACLMKDFKIQAVGFPTESAAEVYNAFAISYKQSSLYQKLWDNGGQTLVLTYNPPGDVNPNTCHGEAFSATKMAMWNMNKCTFSTGNAYLIIHEIGHIISFRNDRLFNSFDYQDLASKDQGCFRSYNNGNPYLKTYIGTGMYPADENFAETLADYILYGSWGRASGLVNFPTQCPTTYKWAYDNVFGVGISAPEGL